MPRGNGGCSGVALATVVATIAVDTEGALIQKKKIAVVLPAYNAASTLERTYAEIPLDVVDEVILVDDASLDTTAEVATRLGIRNIIKHEKNRG